MANANKFFLMLMKLTIRENCFANIIGKHTHAQSPSTSEPTQLLILDPFIVPLRIAVVKKNIRFSNIYRTKQYSVSISEIRSIWCGIVLKIQFTWLFLLAADFRSGKL